MNAPAQIQSEVGRNLNLAHDLMSAQVAVLQAAQHVKDLLERLQGWQET
jgi:hypothetical protein